MFFNILILKKIYLFSLVQPKERGKNYNKEIPREEKYFN